MAAAKERLEARISVEEKRLIEEAAARQGQTVSAFVVASAHDAAVRTLQAFDAIALTKDDQQAFVSALLNPPEPSSTLRRAAQAFLRAKR
jgi:uncharacterized protein (DUF1778 family)